MKPLELGWGNPTFLLPYWNEIDLRFPSSIANHYIFGHIAELEQSIKKLHCQEKNANVSNKHIVIGNGATQLLVGILKILNKPVTAREPYFSRFRNFAEVAGVSWNRQENGIELVTTPNNPDGSVTIVEVESVLNPILIHDLSYNWLQYTVPVEYDKEIMIFSLAKCTGHASTRIGWAILKDEALAGKLKDYVEYSTCGVSIEAQTKANALIESQFNSKNTVFQFGKEILDSRHTILNNINLPFKKLNNTGMFLWLTMDNYDAFFKEKNIAYTDGSTMGSPGHARINLGCSEEVFEEFIKRIKRD